MLISYNWLQSYFDEKLPSPEKVGEVLTFAGFEVESIEAIDHLERDGTKPTPVPSAAAELRGTARKGTEKDYVLDVKVLADRACYALSHRGLAREVSAALEIPLNKGGAESARRGLLSPLPKGATHSDVRGLFFPRSGKEKPITESPIPDPNIGIEEPKLCTKFVARRIENIKVGPSPQWLREALEAIGQRSINSIVDATNFVMFDIGRPSHAFDADKVKGKLTVRRAKKGEVIVTLDNKRVGLNNGELVMADDKGPVGLAGIKGGKRTEVDESTRNIILEAANWNPSYIRLTATATGIKTEASRRFENRISPLLGEEGIDAVTRLIAEVAETPETKFGKRIALSFEKPEQRKLAVDPKRISQKLGIPVSEKAVVDALARLGIVCEKTNDGLMATIPYERLDLSIPEDIAEEVARIIGYDKIPAILPPRAKGETEIPQSFYYEWKIRELLVVKEGFSEVYTSSFVDRGDIEILASVIGKNFLRSNLLGVQGPALNSIELSDVNAGLLIKMSANKMNAPLLGLDVVKMFEIGKVFTENGEQSHLAFAVWNKKGREETIANFNNAVARLTKELGELPIIKDISGENWCEINLDKLVERLPVPDKWDISIPVARAEKFAPFSFYPFIVRDVALFVSSDTTADSVVKVIKENAGELIVRGPTLFDEFTKDGKKSLAFRLVFQSSERTLTDEEVNKVMERVTNVLNSKTDWQVR